MPTSDAYTKAYTHCRALMMRIKSSKAKSTLIPTQRTYSYIRVVSLPCKPNLQKIPVWNGCFYANQLKIVN